MSEPCARLGLEQPVYSSRDRRAILPLNLRWTLEALPKVVAVYPDA
jgi:hypothetical protein